MNAPVATSNTYEVGVVGADEINNLSTWAITRVAQIIWTKEGHDVQNKNNRMSEF